MTSQKSVGLLEQCFARDIGIEAVLTRSLRTLLVQSCLAAAAFSTPAEPFTDQARIKQGSCDSQNKIVHPTCNSCCGEQPIALAAGFDSLTCELLLNDQHSSAGVELRLCPLVSEAGDEHIYGSTTSCDAQFAAVGCGDSRLQAERAGIGAKQRPRWSPRGR